MDSKSNGYEDKFVTVNVTKRERKVLEEKAEKLGLSLNDLVCDVLSNYLLQQQINEEKKRRKNND